MSSSERAERDEHLGEHEAADIVLGCAPVDLHERALRHAVTCPECEAVLRAHAAAHDRARLRLREGVLEAGLPKFARPAPAARSARWGANPRLILAAAATFVAVASVPFLMRARHHDTLPQPWLTAGRDAIRRDAIADPHLAAGIEAYARRDLATARHELEAAHTAGSADAARRLYLASTLLAQGEARQAIELLQAVRFEVDVPEPWRNEGYRTLEAAYRQAGLSMQADSVAAVLHAEEERRQP